MLSTIVAALACIAPLQNVDNPEYERWALFKKGAYVKLKTVFDPNLLETELVMTQTLLEVTPEKVVIEQKSQLPSIPPIPTLPPTGEVPADPPKPPDTRTIFAKIPVLIEPSEPKPEVKEGDEELEVAGKKFKCHWVETVTKTREEKSTMRTWYCSEIPGGVARRETKTEAQVTSTMKTWVAEYKLE